jgi:hypothetical protein
MIRIAQQVSRAIRILRGNRDESARASHLVVSKEQFVNNDLLQVNQAEREKCSQSTFSERKIMKTAFKRVALVAAAALAIGGISAVSAQATGSLTVTATTNTPVTSTFNTVTITNASTDHNYSITSSGVGTLVFPSSAAEGNLSVVAGTEYWYAGATPSALVFSGSTGASHDLVLSAYSATAGTQTITVTGDSSAAVTLTLTWGAAPSFSAGLSKAILNNTTHAAAASASSDDTVVADKSAAAGEIAVTVNNGSGTAFNGTTVTASVSGPGLIAIDTTPTAAGLGNAKVATSGTLTGANVAYVHISGDGTAGVSTITVSVTSGSTTTVLSTKTVTFTGSVAALKAVGNLSVLKAGGTLGTAAGQVYNSTLSATDATTISGATGTIPVTVFATDANGNKTNAAASVKIVSSDSTVLTAGACTASTGADAVVGEYNCIVSGTALAASGKTATITAEASTDGGTTFTILATPVTFTIGGSIASAVLSTDSATYAPLSPIKVVYTAKDSAGNAAYDQDLTAFSTALTSSILLGGTLAAPTSILNGVGTKSGAYAPASEYAGITITGTDAGSNALSATFNVGSTAATDAANAATDAANEATDAANAATDAANAAADSADAATQAAQDAGDKADAALAAVTALSQQVTTLLAKVAALSAVIAKIAKKVKA